MTKPTPQRAVVYEKSSRTSCEVEKDKKTLNKMLILLLLYPYQRHIDPVVRKYAGHISRGAPMTGEGQLTADLRKYVLLYT